MNPTSPSGLTKLGKVSSHLILQKTLVSGGPRLDSAEQNMEVFSQETWDVLEVVTNKHGD